jgi:hypothetical protein
MSGPETKQRKPDMKTLIAVAALAAAIASPALAQTAQSGSAVIVGNQNIGSDPDANVRFDLLREANTRNGSF